MDIFDLAIIKNGAEDLFLADRFSLARQSRRLALRSTISSPMKDSTGPCSEHRFNEAVTDHISAYYALNAPIEWRDTKLSRNHLTSFPNSGTGRKISAVIAAAKTTIRGDGRDARKVMHRSCQPAASLRPLWAMMDRERITAVTGTESCAADRARMGW